MKHPRIRSVGAAACCILFAVLAFADRQTDSQTISTSGTSTTKISNYTGSKSASFEEIIAGTPATVSIVIKGCKSAGTCDVLETNTTTTASQIRTPTISTVYDYFLIIPSWTGGTNVSVQINTTLTTASNGSSGGGGPPTGAAGGSLAGSTYPNPILSDLGTVTAAQVAALFSGCSGVQYLGFDGNCHNAGGPPSGAAGGDLAGSTYPNPTIGIGKVTDDKASLSVKPSVTVIANANTALSGLLTIDGVVTADGSIVLATAQSTGSQNGPWVVHSGAWTRPTWYPSGGTTQAIQFSTTFVRLGTAFQGSTWRMTTAAPVTIDTTATTWTQTPLVLGASSVTGTLPAAQMPAFTGDCTSSSGTVSLACGKINGTSLAGLATGILKNTAGTGIPSIATASDLPSGYTWDKLGSPGANQTLTMTGFSTTWNWGSTNTNQFKFDTNGNPTFGLVSPTTAVTNSPTITILGSYQNAATPTFAADSWTIQDVIGAGTNGTSKLTFVHSGTTGASTIVFPSPLVLPNGSAAAAALGFAGASTSGLFYDTGGNTVAIAIAGTTLFGVNSGGQYLPQGKVFGWSSNLLTTAPDVALSREGAGILDIGTGSAGSKAGSINLTNLTATGTVSAALHATATNCASSGGTCSAAAAGRVSIAASATTVTVATTAVSANSEILVFEDASLGSALSVTCNTTTGRTYTVTSRTAGTSFVITSSAAPSANPACLSYMVMN